MKSKSSAILLLGPTGSGKTPLGNYIEQNGFAGEKCFHFDFGANLRKASELLSGQDAEFVNSLLKSGALLDDKDFHIAKRLLEAFLKEHHAGADNLIVLNGLPRHVGQAERMDKFVDVNMVLFLECSVADVFERIKRNSGGDRAERVDDTVNDIKRKLDVFQKRTMPLLDHYHGKGVRIEKIQVKVDSMPADILKQLRTKSE